VVSYFDLWKGGKDDPDQPEAEKWLDTDGDGKKDRPGQRKPSAGFIHYIPEEFLKQYTITRVEAVRPVTQTLYEQSGGRHYGLSGKPEKMSWEEFEYWYNGFQPTVHGIKAELVDAKKGKAKMIWDITLKTPANVYAVDIKDKRNRQLLGIDPKVKISEMTQGWRYFMPAVLNWYGIPKELPDLYVADLDPGTNQTLPGETYQGTVVFGLKDTYKEPVKARLELTHNGYPISSVHGKTVAFNPGEEKEYTFSFTGIEGKDSVIVARIVPVEPDGDIDYSNNEMKMVISAIGVAKDSGEGTLILKAKSPEGYDVWGRWQPSVERPVNTAKYGDTITAYFTAPGPPDVDWDCYRLKEWKLIEAKIVYPKRHPDFTFGWPKPPQGTVTLGMKIDEEENKATASFLEDWSINGANVYILPEKRMVDGPTYYTVTVNYKMLWEYRKGRKECDENGCRCVDWEDHSRTLSKTVSVKLLVNGTP